MDYARDIDVYVTTAKRKIDQEQHELMLRKDRAWETARRAAILLKEKFGVSRVVIFGSLVHKGCFTRWSDVDIAAWGISPEDTFRAMSTVMDVAADIEVNLIDVGVCHPALLDVIEREGIEL